MSEWLPSATFAALAGITDRHARRVLKNFSKARAWQGMSALVRVRKGRGGRSGVRYEVLLSSLSEELQAAFRGACDEPDTTANLAAVSVPPPPKFVAAPNQTATERERHKVLRLIAETEKGTRERATAIEEASRHHGVPLRTLQRWVERCDTYGWDLDAMGRKKPANAGKQRVWISRDFDKRFRAAGYEHNELASLAAWLTREIAGWWQSPVQRAGWKRVRLEVLTSLKRECRERGFDLPKSAFTISRRRVEELRYHCAVDVMKHDAKRHDDSKPRIRRDNSRLLPMEQIVMDVKPLDCVLSRPDGSLAYPKLIGFMDAGTHRLYGRIVLLKSGEGVRQEHVTDAFIDMVQDPHWGFPQQLYTDNGSEYKHFDLIREALKMIAEEGARVIIKARPYSGASKPIESKFSVIDRHIISQMQGYTGSNRMDKKVQRVGKAAVPYPGPVEAFEQEFLLRLADFETWPIDSGPFKGRSPQQIYIDHVEQGWRPVSVNRIALDCAFAKQRGDRKIDRGVITLDSTRYRHPELAAFTGRRVRVVEPYRRNSWPLAELPDLGWVALEPEMLALPGDISGAKEAGRLQKRRNQAVRALKAQANVVDPLENGRERVVMHPSATAPNPIMDLLMSPEAERVHRARLEAESKVAALPTAAERERARRDEETRLLEKKYGRG